MGFSGAITLINLIYSVEELHSIKKSSHLFWNYTDTLRKEGDELVYYGLNRYAWLLSLWSKHPID